MRLGLTVLRAKAFGRGLGDSIRWSVVVLIGIAVLVVSPHELVAQGCAMCKTALGGPEDPLARGLNISILFLMSMPFLLVAGVGGWLFYMFRRVRRRGSALRPVPIQKEEMS
jgi:hypothetical protein